MFFAIVGDVTNLVAFVNDEVADFAEVEGSFTTAAEGFGEIQQTARSANHNVRGCFTHQ